MAEQNYKKTSSFIARGVVREEKSLVIAVEADAVIVQTQRASTCGSCASKTIFFSVVGLVGSFILTRVNSHAHQFQQRIQPKIQTIVQ